MSGQPIVKENVYACRCHGCLGEVRVEQRPEPRIVEPTDAIIRLPATSICGSDLWPYRGIEAVDEPRPMGHEYAGIGGTVPVGGTVPAGGWRLSAEFPATA